MRAFDLKVSWIHRFTERLEIEPSTGIYDLFNFTNYDLPPNILTGLLTGTAGSVNGTTPSDRITNRVGLGTGVFALALRARLNPKCGLAFKLRPKSLAGGPRLHAGGPPAFLLCGDW